jgi:hypothetical protein
MEVAICLQIVLEQHPLIQYGKRRHLTLFNGVGRGGVIDVFELIFYSGECERDFGGARGLSCKPCVYPDQTPASKSAFDAHSTPKESVVDE